MSRSTKSLHNYETALKVLRKRCPGASIVSENFALIHRVQLHRHGVTPNSYDRSVCLTAAFPIKHFSAEEREKFLARLQLPKYVVIDFISEDTVKNLFAGGVNTLFVYWPELIKTVPLCCDDLVLLKSKSGAGWTLGYFHHYVNEKQAVVVHQLANRTTVTDTVELSDLSIASAEVMINSWGNLLAAIEGGEYWKKKYWDSAKRIGEDILQYGLADASRMLASGMFERRR